MSRNAPSSTVRRPLAALAAAPDRTTDRTTARPTVLLVALAVAVSVLVLALVLAGAAPQPSLPGLPDAGSLTGWGLPTLDLLQQLAAVAAVGSLLTAVALVPSVDGSLGVVALRAARSAVWTSGAWALMAALSTVLTLSDVVGRPAYAIVADGPSAWGEVLAVSPARALLVSAAAAVAVAAGAGRVRSTAGGWLVLLVALVALTPSLFTGHATGADDHSLATTSLVVHVVAAAVWVGGLLGLVVHLRAEPPLLTVAAPLFSRLALLCFVLLGVTGLVGAWIRLGASGTAWTTGYGSVLLAKTAAFGALGVLGWRHRRRMLPRLAAGQPGAFRRLIAVEVVVLAGTVGLAAALSRTPTPSAAADTGTAALPSHGSGHATLDDAVEPLSASALLTQWQPDAIALSLIVLAALAYGQGVLVLLRRGQRWPAPRVLAFGAGLGLALFATSGGLASYAPALFSVHLARSLVLAVLVPLLLVLGGPLALGEQVRPAPPGSLRALVRTGPVAAVASNPINGVVAFGAVASLLYTTPLLDLSLRSIPGHLVATGATVAAGLLLVTGLLPRSSPLPVLERSAIALLVGTALLGCAVALRVRDTLFASTWFAELGWAWSTPVADQQRGATVIVVTLQIVALVLLVAAACWRPDVPAVPVDSDGAVVDRV